MTPIDLLFSTILVVQLWRIAKEDMRTRMIPVYKTMSISVLAVLRLLYTKEIGVVTAGAAVSILIYFVSACPATVPAKRRMGGADYRVFAGLLLYFGIDAVIAVALGCLFLPVIMRKTEPVIETEDGRYLLNDICERLSASKSKNPNRISFPFTVTMAAGVTMLYALVTPAAF